jgi:hypothetical protein
MKRKFGKQLDRSEEDCEPFKSTERTTTNLMVLAAIALISFFVMVFLFRGAD